MSEAADLAIHAADRAIQIIFDTASSAGDDGISLSVLQIGMHLTAAMAGKLGGATDKFGASMGLQENRVEVSI